MTTGTGTISIRTGSTRRLTSLARAEALLFWRNRTALFTALAAPVGGVGMALGLGLIGSGSGAGATIVIMMTSMALLFVVYTNLVPALVARREELVLKRLRTGEVSDAQILTGTAVPSIAVAWGQILVVLVAAFAAFGLAMPVNPVLVVAAVVLGTAVFALLAAVTTAITRNVETAQVTVLPLMLVAMVCSGLYFPLSKLPDIAETVMRFTPLTPVVDLLRLGLLGQTVDGATVGMAASFGAAAVPLLVLGAWVAAGAWATRRWFRWEPRR